MKQIKITVAGLTNTGKSAVMAIIKDALDMHGGHNVKINDIDGEMDTIKAKRIIEMIGDEMVIDIEQIQLNRSGVENVSMAK